MLKQTVSPKSKEIPVKAVPVKGIPVNAVPMITSETSMPNTQAISAKAPPEVPVAIHSKEQKMETYPLRATYLPNDRLKFHRAWYEDIHQTFVNQMEPFL